MNTQKNKKINPNDLVGRKLKIHGVQYQIMSYEGELLHNKYPFKEFSRPTRKKSKQKYWSLKKIDNSHFGLDNMYLIKSDHMDALIPKSNYYYDKFKQIAKQEQEEEENYKLKLEKKRDKRPPFHNRFLYRQNDEPLSLTYANEIIELYEYEYGVDIQIKNPELKNSILSFDIYNPRGNCVANVKLNFTTK